MNEYQTTNRESLQKEPFLKITVRGVTPSLNALFGMTHWQRLSVKKKIQDAFISALQPKENGSSTQIILSSNTTLTASGMLERFQTIVKETLLLKQNKKRLAKTKKRL